MLTCRNCNYLNPQDSKFCNQCSQPIPALVSSAQKVKTINPVKSEKRLVIFSLLIVSTLIIGLSIQISPERNGIRILKPTKAPVAVRRIPSAEEVTRRMKIARLLNEELPYDPKGSPLTIELRGKYSEALRICSPTLPDEFYEDFGKQTELIRKLRQEGFEVVIFADDTKHRNYYLDSNN